MNDRYTSPETSRLLAAAFTHRDSRDFSSSGAWWRNLHRTPPSLVTGTVERPRCYENERYGGADLQAVRALDLTDVLHELTRPRPEEKDARPLCEKVYVLTQDSGRSWNAIGVRPDEEVIDHDVEINGDAGEPPVEAAALVLLALLRERRETEADIDKSMRRSMDGPDPDLLNAIKASAMTRGKRERKS